MADIEATRAVVEPAETFDGPIRPSRQTDLGRSVRLRADATVKGSVYGDGVIAESGVTVEGSVMAPEGDGIELTGTTVTGDIGTPGRVVCEDSRIDGTVTGTRVRLSDCTVVGNVVGDEVIVEGGTVLGIVAAERSVELHDTTCYTVRSRDTTTLDDVSLVLPQAIVGESVTLETNVTVTGLGRVEVEPDEPPRLPRLTEADVYEDDDTTYLTLAPRIMNLDRVTDRLASLEETVTDAARAVYDESDHPNVDETLDLLEPHT